MFQKSEKRCFKCVYYEHRWPKADELDDYNHSIRLLHRGDGFVVYETDDCTLAYLKKLEGEL